MNDITNNQRGVPPQQEAGYARLAAVASPASCEALPALRILRLPEVITRVGLKRASIYLHVNKGTFPKPIPLGPRAVGWLEHEIDAWLIIRMQIRRGHRSGSV
ncbi:MAG: AlpA family transcriptional regulator [Alphaproteobacteria bacterium]|nr:AlpA family transcriptional regulator [Alphaproteobacteria bacterium]